MTTAGNIKQVIVEHLLCGSKCDKVCNDHLAGTYYVPGTVLSVFHS